MTTPRTGTKRTAAALGAVLIAVAVHASSLPEATPRLELAPKSQLVLRGKSTMHDFTSTATRMHLEVALADLPAGASSLARLSQPGAVKSVVLTVPVEGLKSEKEGLDKNMYKALKASASPNIVFRLEAPPTEPAAGAYKVAGELEVAGQRQPIEMDVHASETPEGIVLQGSKALLMSSFGIKPPSMFLGTLKTSDRVVVEWRLVLTHNGF
jgi:hypothetical protein